MRNKLRLGNTTVLGFQSLVTDKLKCRCDELFEPGLILQKSLSSLAEEHDKFKHTVTLPSRTSVYVDNSMH